VIGSPATVRARLEALVAETGVDEVMAIASVPDAGARMKSFTLLAELAELPG
jgi:alkanesulfonate monooxygenase SsuD/methylene tetrahydromethanopterin reductase-like flavin-dependent oxidoreductase (luciferase family)